jgi:hypothetical protein
MAYMKYFFILSSFFIFLSILTHTVSLASASFQPPCFFLGDIVKDTTSPYSQRNKITFYDGRAIQLYALGKLSDGYSKSYIQKHSEKISDFSRKIPTIPEKNDTPDWYDGRVALLGSIFSCGFNIQKSQLCPESISSLLREKKFASEMQFHLGLHCYAQ